MGDPTPLTDLAHQFVRTISPLIARGVLARVSAPTTDQTSALVGRLWALLTQQFQGNRRATAALTVFEDEPNDPQSQARLIQQAVPGTTPPLPQRSITVRDQAQVGTAIAGDIQGSLTIGPISFGDRVNGDKISGDITTGAVAGTGSAIGHNGQAQVDQRNREGPPEG